MLTFGRSRHIIAVVPTDELVRAALSPVVAWQRAFGWNVRVVLVVDGQRQPPADSAVQRFRRWATDESDLGLAGVEVSSCTSQTLVECVASLGGGPGDVLVYPANAGGVLALSRTPIVALWSELAAQGASMILSQRGTLPHRVLVLTDGTPRTLPVLETAFELAAHLDVQLSHLDSRGGAGCEGDDGYFRMLKRAMAAVVRAPNDLRPDFLLLGVTREEQGAALLADLTASLLPCSLLVVPIPTAGGFRLRSPASR